MSARCSPYRVTARRLGLGRNSLRRSRDVSAAVGTMTGLVMFAGGLLGIWLFVLSVRSLLDRWRRRCWAAEWESVAGTWCRC